MQATGNKGEFGHLRAYLISKLMWDPEANPDAIIEDFLMGYYGKAAPFVNQYIEKMRLSLLNDNFRLNIFGDPRDSVKNYLASERMNEYNDLFDNAEKAGTCCRGALQAPAPARGGCCWFPPAPASPCPAPRRARRPAIWDSAAFGGTCHMNKGGY